MPASDRDEALKDLGRIAKERREDAGLSLDDIFERTRVRIEFLRGIEQGGYHGFPDLVYTKGFVRTYLGVIGADDLKEEFMAWLNEDSSSKERRIPPTNVLGNTTYPTKGFKPASHFWLFVILFLVMAGSGGYVWYSWAHIDDIIPFYSNNQLNGAAISSDEESADITSASIALLPSSPSQLSSHDNQFKPAVVSEEPKPKPITPYLHIRAANGDVWIEVTISGKVVASRTLKRGSEASWDLPARARVRYGNSSAAVILNGKELSNASARGTYYYSPDGTFSRNQ